MERKETKKDMPTIAEFKRRMIAGSKWIFTANYLKEPIERTCTVSQSNSFALTGLRNPKESSWCDWPSKNSSQINFIDGKMIIRINFGPNEEFLQYEEKED